MSDTEILVSKDGEESQELATGLQDSCQSPTKPEVDVELGEVTSPDSQEAPVLPPGPPPYSTVVGDTATEGVTAKPLPPAEVTDNKSGAPATSTVRLYPPPTWEEQQQLQQQQLQQQPIFTQPRARVHNRENDIKPNNFMEFSICNCVVSCICCAWLALLVSIVPLVFSNAVNSAWNRGDVDSAKYNSRCARNWNIVAVICLIASLIVSGVLAYIRFQNMMEEQQEQ